MRRFAAALVAAWLSIPALRAADDLETQMKAVLAAYAAVEQNAADPVAPDQAFYQGAIPGLLRSLDPHSVFFDPDQFQQLKQMETSTQKGFGSVVSLSPGRVTVLQTLPGTPSGKAGLAPGDEILAINGYEVARLDLEQLQQLLGETRQQQAQMVVRRPGSARVLQFTLTPEEMQTPSVDLAFFVGPAIGYIRVSSFEEKTVEQLKAAIEKLGGKQLAGLILDFRNNPGGLVGAAVRTAALFLEPGQAIVTVRGRNVPETSEAAPLDAQPYPCKLAILINGKTASASEIVSGALQDHDRATILGEPSYGKGLVQSVFPLSQSTGLALTTALYYAPSGRSIQKPLDPAKFALAGATANTNAKTAYRTDKGRPVAGGGGIQPDVVVFPEPLNRLRAAMEASGSFTSFATEYLRGNKITQDFEITSQIADRFRVFLFDRSIQPGVAEWLRERNFVYGRLKVEIFNQAFGVEKGEEVEAQRDPAIQKAVEVLGS